MTTKYSSAKLAAVLLAASTSIVVFAMPAQAASEPKLSRSVAKHLIDAQKAMTGKDLKTAADDIAQAKAVSDRTPYDDYVISRMEMAVWVGSSTCCT